MRLGVLAFLVCLLLVTSAHAAERAITRVPAGKRVALVIGNGAYQLAPLKNPANDARDIAATLKKLGFEVIHKENASKKVMLDALSDFSRKLPGAEAGLVFFAGHGMQVNGQNYLIPVGSRVEAENDVEFEAVNAGRMLAKMEDARCQTNIVILDACRNNPFARSFRSSTSGLAKMDAPTGSLIAYSTAPGSVAADGSGRNSVFTKHLLKYMKQPGLHIGDILMRSRVDVLNETGQKQVPWESSSLTGYFYFTGATTASVEKPQTAPPALQANTEEDTRRAIRDVMNMSTRAVNNRDYYAFVSLYSNDAVLTQSDGYLSINEWMKRVTKKKWEIMPWSIISKEIHEISIDGDTAVVKTTLNTLFRGKKVTFDEDYTLKRMNGEWKIVREDNPGDMF